MRAERLGSYSIAVDGRRHAGLVALEVDHAVEALVAAAAVTRRDAARVVAAAGLRAAASISAGSGSRLGDLREVEAGLEAAAGRRGAVLDDRHRA